MHVSAKSAPHPIFLPRPCVLIRAESVRTAGGPQRTEREGRLVSPQRDTQCPEPRSPGCSECHPIWTRGLYRGDHVRMGSLGCVVTQQDGYPYRKGKLGHREVLRAGDRNTQGEGSQGGGPGPGPPLSALERGRTLPTPRFLTSACRTVRPWMPPTLTPPGLWHLDGSPSLADAVFRGFLQKCRDR